MILFLPNIDKFIQSVIGIRKQVGNDEQGKLRNEKRENRRKQKWIE